MITNSHINNNSFDGGAIVKNVAIVNLVKVIAQTKIKARRTLSFLFLLSFILDRHFLELSEKSIFEMCE